MNDDDPTTRTTGPKTPEEHAYIWTGAKRGHDAWLVTGPIIAVVRNWKAVVAVGFVIVFFNKPEIIAAMSTLLGIGP